MCEFFKTILFIFFGLPLLVCGLVLISSLLGGVSLWLVIAALVPVLVALEG